ncbi:uncharacterized protein LOC143899432 [Temnothorax americanus]|uniref:uncharacterized protein LOC143899432 n=1 Tax=Temnothorax americanus TaxID=1964332 RepID=UPI004068F781
MEVQDIPCFSSKKDKHLRKKEKKSRAMNYRLILRPDLQDLLNKYKKIRDKFSALCVFSEQQQKSLEFEREQSKKIKNNLKNMFCWFMKREDRYKANLDSLEKKNKELNYNLANVQRERDHAVLLNNAKVSELQVEIDLLRVQIEQLRNNHKQQLMLQDKSHEDEISKYKRLLDNTNAKSLSERSVMKKDKCKNVKKNIVINEENRKRKEKLYDELPGLEVDKVVRKRRKLFQDDKEVSDIV